MNKQSNSKKQVQICIQTIKKSDFIKTNSCEFGLCPKKYKFLANPQLLEEIFTNPNPQINETTKSTKNKGWMDVIACESCGQQGLLRLDNPLCVSCRRIY